MKSSAFIISLERATTRLEHAKSLLELLPMPAEILPAVDGSTLSDQQIASVYTRHKHQLSYPFELGVGEIGCFLSHRKAWQQIVDRKLDAGLILEDDVHIDAKVLERSIAFIRQHASEDAYIQLPARGLPRQYKVIQSNETIAMVLPSITMLRTSGQWVTKHAAMRLLEATEKFDRPVDTTLQLHWYTKVRPLTLLPSGLSDLTDELGGSTIGTKKRNRLTIKKLRREVNRTIYRMKIAGLSRHAAKLDNSTLR